MKDELKKWHISLIEKVQKTTGISNYQIVWLSFIEGLIIGLIIGYLF
jgi:ABC-type antimicrobial peptide transport system permease subunit